MDVGKGDHLRRCRLHRREVTVSRVRKRLAVVNQPSTWRGAVWLAASVFSLIALREGSENLALWVFCTGAGLAGLAGFIVKD